MIRGIDQDILNWIDNTLQIPDIRHVDFVRLHVQFIKNKDPSIQNILIMSHLKIIIKPALYYYRKSCGDDIFFELVNECVICMCKALQDFNSCAGVYFASFIRQRIWRCCYWFCQKRYPRCLQGSISLDDKDQDGIKLDELISSPDITMENIYSNDDYNWLTSDLDKREKQIIDGHFKEEKPWKIIAQKLNMTKRTIAYRKNKILEKIKIGCV